MDKALREDEFDVVYKNKIRRRKRKYRRNRQIVGGFLVVLLVVIIAIVVNIGVKNNANSPDKIYTKIQGVWRIDDVTKYQFDGDGTGEMLLPDKSYKFTYKVKDDEIFFDFESELVIDTRYKYSLKNDTLTISDIKYKEIVYVMEKE